MAQSKSASRFTQTQSRILPAEDLKQARIPSKGVPPISKLNRSSSSSPSPQSSGPNSNLSDKLTKNRGEIQQQSTSPSPPIPIAVGKPRVVRDETDSVSSSRAQPYSLNRSYLKAGVQSKKRKEILSLFGGFQQFNADDDTTVQDSAAVTGLDDWKVKHVTLKQHEFAIQSHTMLSEVVNNTKNYRYEKQMEDCQRFDIIFRPRNHTKYLASTPGENKSFSLNVNRLGQHHGITAGDTLSTPKRSPLSHNRSGQTFLFNEDRESANRSSNNTFLGGMSVSKMKDLQEQVVTDVVANKTLRKILYSNQSPMVQLKKKPYLSGSFSVSSAHRRSVTTLRTSGGDSTPKESPDKIQLLVDNTPSLDIWKSIKETIDSVCTVYLLEDIVGGFKHLAEQYSVSQIHSKAAESALILKRAVDERRETANLETVKQNHHEDIRRCEETHKELLKIQKAFADKVSLFEASIYRTKQRIHLAEGEIVAVEREKAGEQVLVGKDTSHFLYKAKQRIASPTSPAKARKLQGGQYKALIAKALLDYLPDPEVERMVPQAYRNKFRLEDALNELRRGLAQSK